MSEPEQVTTVTIYNQTYHVRSEGGSEYVQQLASYVDQKMVELSEKTPTVDTLRVAVLTALNIADEYLKTRKKLDNLEQAVAETTGRLKGMVKPFLDSSSP